MGAAHHELARGVHQQAEISVKQILHALGQSLAHARQQDGAHVVLDAAAHGLVGLGLRGGGIGQDEFVVLRRHHHGVHAHGAVLLVVFHRHLALAVGAQVGHLAAFAADGREFLDEGVA